MLKKISSVLFVLTLVLTPFFALLSKTNAQAYRGQILDQLLFDIGVVDPGDVISRKFTVTHDYQPLDNGSDRLVNLFTYSQDMKLGLQGNRIMLRKDEVADGARLSDWISLDKPNFTMDERLQVEEINVTIKIPDYAEPGGKYAVVWVSNRDGAAELEKISNDANGAASGANADVGIPVLLTVSGDLDKNIEADKLYTTNILGTVQSLFLDSHPVNAVVEFKNSGNVHVAPRGRVYFHTGDNFVKDAFASFDLNPNEFVVLPGSSRQFTFTWDDSFISTQIQKDADGKVIRDEKNTVQYFRKYDFDKLSKIRIGSFKVTVQYDYVDEYGNTVASKTIATTFTIFPWEIILIILLIIFFIFIKVVLKRSQNQNKVVSKRRK